jgi:tRNA(Ile)-lysidine synthase
LAAKPLSMAEFSVFMNRLLVGGVPQNLGLAVSGGPDSMALAALMAGWASQQTPILKLHALVIDHGLRAGAAAEAALTKSRLKQIPGISKVQILKWTGRKPKTRIMEGARNARYALMAAYCKKYKVTYICTGHHQDDQAETVLFRLAKGSGLDGLCGMRPLQVLETKAGAITLLRPLLNVPKDRLVATCAAQKLEFVKDESNHKLQYARPRLREVKSALEAEGLSALRLSRLAERIEKARKSIDFYSGQTYNQAFIKKNTKQIVLKKSHILAQPEEIVLRVLIQSMDTLKGETDYGPRLERLETLAHDMLNAKNFRKRTLGGMIFSRNDPRDEIIVEIEI